MNHSERHVGNCIQLFHNKHNGFTHNYVYATLLLEFMMKYL